MAEIFLSTLLLMFISSHYFVYNVTRDTESDTVIQMTLEHVLLQRFKKKICTKKINFLGRHVNVAKRANFSSRII